MRPVRLLIKNFMSHPSTEIRFREGLTYYHGRNLDDGGSNGSGKSTVIYAIVWALWGRIPLTHKKDDLISHWADSCYVEFELVGEAGHLTIFRDKRRGTGEVLSLQLYNQIVEGDLAMVQAKLESFLGISWKVFCNTIYLGPDSAVAEFCRTTDAQRAQILGELIDDSEYQEAGKNLGGHIQAAEMHVDLLSTQLTEMEKSLDHWRGDMARLQAAYNTEREAHRLKEQEALQTISQLEVKILQFKEQLRHAPSRDVATVRAEQTLVAERQRTLLDQMATYRVEASFADPEVGKPCPCCGVVFTSANAQHLSSYKTGRQNRLQQLSEEHTHLQRCLGDLGEEMRTLQSWAGIKTTLHGQIDDCQAGILRVRNSMENQALVYLHSEFQVANQRYTETAVEVAVKQQELAAMHLRMPVLKTIHRGLTKEIRNMMLDGVRTTLEYYTAQNLHVLAGSSLQVRFPQVTNTGAEKFDIEVLRDGRPNPLVSRGQDYRVQVAILLALRRLIASQQVTPLQFLLLDDPLSKADDAGGLAFGQLMGYLKQSFSNVLITIPREIEGLEEGDCHKVVVEYYRRQSRVIDVE